MLISTSKERVINSEFHLVLPSPVFHNCIFISARALATCVVAINVPSCPCLPWLRLVV